MLRRLITTMMNRHSSFVASIILSLPIIAAAVETQPNCDSPERGSDLIACSAIRHKTADTEMNATYKELRSVLQERGEAETNKRLQQAQRAWLGFQRSHCEFESTYEGASGSFISSKWGDCLTNTTIDRTKYLQELLKYFK
jgi:uncharacterized protein YecT (DUF1311 family)